MLYSKQLEQGTPTRFWLNNPTPGEAEKALELGNCVNVASNTNYVKRMLAEKETKQEALQVIDALICQGIADEHLIVALTAQHFLGKCAEVFRPLFEKTDGKELPKLVQKSRDAGMQVEAVIGDKAYSDKKNIEAAKKDGYELIAKLNSIITQGNRTKEDEFEFNKDAGMYQCKAGHLAIHKYLDKRKKEKKNKNPRMVYFFDIEKCKCCPYRNGCYKEGAKKKTYTETIISDSHSEQAKFQETEHFKEKMKERYKIEAKNSELKHRHGYDTASSSGLICMEMQGAMTIFAVNLKRIVKLINEK